MQNEVYIRNTLIKKHKLARARGPSIASYVLISLIDCCGVVTPWAIVGSKAYCADPMAYCGEPITYWDEPVPR